MNKKILILIIIFSICFVLCSCNSGGATNQERVVQKITADYKEYDDAEALVDDANLVFTGKVVDVRYEYLDIRSSIPETEVESEKEEPLPYTIFSVEVIDTFKGNAENDIVELSVWVVFLMMWKLS